MTSAATSSRLRRWFIARLPVDSGNIRLTQNRIYILPTRHGCLLALLIAMMLLGALNYGTSLGFIMSFLLVGLGLVSILHSFRNLHGLEVQIQAAAPVFAGEQAHFKIIFHNQQNRAYYALEAACAEAHAEVAAVESQHFAEAELRLSTQRRGRLHLPPVRLSSVFPLGLLQAWTWLKSSSNCLVYPQPLLAEDSAPLPRGHHQHHEGGSASLEKEDFAGLRDYRPGDAPRQIAWRHYAKHEELLSKEYAGHAGDDVCLRWQAIAHADPEYRLAQLCRWILDAEAQGLRYSLEIPGFQRANGQGQSHQLSCLEALALYVG